LPQVSVSSPPQTSHATHPEINSTSYQHASSQPPDTIAIPEWTSSINSIENDSSYSFTRTTWTVTEGRTDDRETVCYKFSRVPLTPTGRPQTAGNGILRHEYCRNNHGTRSVRSQCHQSQRTDDAWHDHRRRDCSDSRHSR
jgi:hypothetical protein